MHTTGQAFFEETEVRGCIVVLYCSVFYLLLTPVPSTEDVALALQKRQDQQDTFRNGAGGGREGGGSPIVTANPTIGVATHRNGKFKMGQCKIPRKPKVNVSHQTFETLKGL